VKPAPERSLLKKGGGYAPHAEPQSRLVQDMDRLAAGSTRSRMTPTGPDRILATGIKPQRISRCNHSGTAFCLRLLAASHMRYAVREEPCMTRFTTIAAMPASTAFACGDASMSMIGFDGCACS
jgi:hypothetical protein